MLVASVVGYGQLTSPERLGLLLDPKIATPSCLSIQQPHPQNSERNSRSKLPQPTPKGSLPVWVVRFTSDGLTLALDGRNTPKSKLQPPTMLLDFARRCTNGRPQAFDNAFNGLPHQSRTLSVRNASPHPESLLTVWVGLACTSGSSNQLESNPHAAEICLTAIAKENRSPQ